MQQFEGLRARIDSFPHDMPDVLYWNLTLNRGMRDMQSAIAWCEESLQLLEEAGHEAD